MNTKLDYALSIKLRRAYGRYMDLRRSDYDTKEEYADDKEECLDEVRKLIGLSGLNIDLKNIQEHLYSNNQRKFIDDAGECMNGELYFDYSGRGMYGDACPAFYCDSHNDIQTSAKTQIDNMGRGLVIYAQY